MTIRPFRPDDEAAVIDLWRACDLLRPWNDPHKDIARKLRVNPELFLVGVIENRVVATVMAGYEGHRGWINYLGVDPSHQRKGLARSCRTAVRMAVGSRVKKVITASIPGCHAPATPPRRLGTSHRRTPHLA